MFPSACVSVCACLYAAQPASLPRQLLLRVLLHCLCYFIYLFCSYIIFVCMYLYIVEIRAPFVVFVFISFVRFLFAFQSLCAQLFQFFFCHLSLASRSWRWLLSRRRCQRLSCCPLFVWIVWQISLLRLLWAYLVYSPLSLYEYINARSVCLSRYTHCF